MIVSALPAHWRTLANDLERYAPVAAQAFRDAADQLEDALLTTVDSVSLAEAAALGGFSVDHIQRLVAKGRIANLGRKGKPRIRRDDVPVKPGHAARLRRSSASAKLSTSGVVASVINEVR